jgi:hypothetical protein
MIDARHDENPSEMRCLVAIRIVRERLGASLGGNGKSGLDSICIRRVQGRFRAGCGAVPVQDQVQGQVQAGATRGDAEKLLCGA